MACDIHCFLEQKTKNGWELVEEVELDRNYGLFSILADVRNGVGFAGHSTGNKLNPIDAPRGIPDDVSKELIPEIQEWGDEGHSHSWLNLDEVLLYDYNNQIAETVGIVNKEQYRVYLEKGKPDSYSSGASEKSVSVISAEEMEEIVKDNRENERDYYIRVAWKETYSEIIGFKFLKKMEKYCKKYSNARIVFWFDN